MELLIKLVSSFVLPPLAVVLHRKLDGHFWLNIVLWILLCHIGGVVHALWAVFCLEDTGGFKL